jgi:hypothetical protein
MDQSDHDAIVKTIADMLEGEREQRRALEARLRLVEARPPGPTKAQIEDLMKSIGQATREGITLRTAPLAERIDQLESRIRALAGKVEP